MFAAAMQVIIQIARKLKVMHDAGYAHCDFKPGNAIWLPSQNTWSLIDFGCTAKVGAPRRSEDPVCTYLRAFAAATVIFASTVFVIRNAHGPSTIRAMPTSVCRVADRAQFLAIVCCPGNGGRLHSRAEECHCDDCGGCVCLRNHVFRAADAQVVLPTWPQRP